MTSSASRKNNGFLHTKADAYFSAKFLKIPFYKNSLSVKLPNNFLLTKTAVCDKITL